MNAAGPVIELLFLLSCMRVCICMYSGISFYFSYFFFFLLPVLAQFLWFVECSGEEDIR